MIQNRIDRFNGDFLFCRTHFQRFTLANTFSFVQHNNIYAANNIIVSFLDKNNIFMPSSILVHCYHGQRDFSHHHYCYYYHFEKISKCLRLYSFVNEFGNKRTLRLTSISCFVSQQVYLVYLEIIIQGILFNTR